MSATRQSDIVIRVPLDDHAILAEVASATGHRVSSMIADRVILHATALQLRLIYAAKGLECDLPDLSGRVASHPAFHDGIPHAVPHPTAPSIPIRITLPTSVVNVLRASAPDGKAETAVRVVARNEAVECRKHRRQALDEALSSG